MTNNLESILKDISERLTNAETIREASIASSRKAIRLSKNMIHAIHAGEDCSTIREEMRDIVSSMDRDSYASKDAMMEDAEAEILYAIVNYKDLPTPAELGVDEGSWLMGMADAIPSTREMGRAYSLSHFSLGFRISRPQTTITRADTAMTATGTRPEVGL